MTIHAANMPATGFEPGKLVRAIRKADRTIDRNIVVVPQNDQLTELQVPGK